MTATRSSTREATRPSGVRIWLMAARVRTLPAAIAPVLVGTALAGFFHVFHPLRFVAALVGAMFIQIGTNLSNDYSDARRGADTEDRLGPVRVTAGGLVPPRQVLIATYLTFGIAVLAGAYLIAVAGSYFVQVEHLDWEAFALAVPVGLIASGILVVNNVRDIDTDRRAGKRTLAVRMGRARTRRMFAVIIYLAYVLTPVTWVFGPMKPWLFLPWLTLPLAARVVRIVRNRTDGGSLNGALAQTGALQLVFCALLAAGLLLSR